jgi:hypothetical protein
MKFLFSSIALLVSLNSFSQYYYNDIFANVQSNKQYQLFKANKIHSIKVSSFDADNQISEGFAASQELSLDYSKMITSSALKTSATSVLTSFYTNDKIQQTKENKSGSTVSTEYQYDEQGRLLKISSVTADTILNDRSTEVHIWKYNADNKPESMLKVKNTTDTTKIVFVFDEKGNPVEEHWKKRGYDIETYYYYYNEKNQLTDIVRFNKRAKKLLPDFVFEYDEQNHVSEMTQVLVGTSNYLISKYTYNDKGLKQTETYFSKTKELLGRVEYSYE